jgi:DNA end-binding protein Ku
MAMQLIEGMSSTFKPEKYKDTYQEKLIKTIEAKSKNQKIPEPEERTEEAAVDDLIEQLKKSLEMAG